MNFIDLTIPEHSYLLGFLQADGSMYRSTRDRGRVRIELSKRDSDILDKIGKLIPYHTGRGERTRTTNFSEIQSVSLSVYSKEFRDELNSLGMPYGKKNEIVEPPKVPFSEKDYFRGLVDGNGSLGITAKNRPFLSLNTSSDSLAAGYTDFVFRLTGFKKKDSRNKRDNTYNLVLFCENAQTVARVLYYDGCLGIKRKIELSQQVAGWVRPKEMKKVDFTRKAWSSSDDAYVLSHPVEESVLHLGRTEKSVNIRMWRLNNLKDSSGENDDG